jgi:hypothetical protein
MSAEEWWIGLQAQFQRKSASFLTKRGERRARRVSWAPVAVTLALEPGERPAA